MAMGGRRSPASATHDAPVQLTAARWAGLAPAQADAWTHVDEGWLLRAVVPDGRRELLTAPLIYNRDVLVVLDRARGCISHVFSRLGARAVCLGGPPSPAADPGGTGRGGRIAADRGAVDRYEGAISGSDAFTFRHQPGARDGTASPSRAAGGGRPDAGVGFRKSIRLTGRTISVCYESAPAGQAVSNEFSVPLAAAAPDGRSVRLVGTDDVQVRVELGPNCRFAPAVLLTGLDRRRSDGGPTEDVELVSSVTGDFSYRIEL